MHSELSRITNWEDRYLETIYTALFANYEGTPCMVEGGEKKIFPLLCQNIFKKTLIFHKIIGGKTREFVEENQKQNF